MTQDNQSELDGLLETIGVICYDRVKQAIEAYVTTRVKEAERLARIDEVTTFLNAPSEDTNWRVFESRLKKLEALTTTPPFR